MVQALRCLLRLAFLAGLSLTTHSTLLASSTIEQCVRTGVGADACERRLLATLSVQNAQELVEGVETFNIVAATDASGEVHSVQDGLQVWLAKSSISLQYPLTYVRDFNNKPKEVIVLRNSGGAAFNALLNPCQDDPGEDVACGWVRNSAGDAIPNSQGFCCRCDLEAMLGIYGTQARSAGHGVECSIWNSQSQTAHCLRMDELWYSAFTVGAPRVQYDLDVVVKHCPAGARGSSEPVVVDPTNLPPEDDVALPNSAYEQPQCSMQVIRLGPNRPTACATVPWSTPNMTSGACDVEVSIEGDFAPWEGTHSFQHQYLVVPSVCDDVSKCGARLADAPGKWMLVDKSRFTLDGSTCNKIGVSYTAFRSQGQRCDVPVQSCLGGQLHDLYALDQAALEAGETGAYFARFQPAGTLTQTRDTTQLVYRTDRYQRTVVALNLNADGLTLIRNVSPGRLLAANVTDFTAFSGNGRLRVVAQNLGVVLSPFTVSVSCSGFIAEVPSKQVTLPVSTSSVAEAEAGGNPLDLLTFALEATRREQGQHWCRISLQDALQREVDTRSVNFTTFAVEVDRGSQGGEAEEGAPDASDTAVAQGSSASCESKCSEWYDMPCAVLQGCWERVLHGLLGILGVVLLGSAIWRAVRCASAASQAPAPPPPKAAH